MATGGDEPLTPTDIQKCRGLRWAAGSEMFGSAYGVMALGSVLILFLDE